MWQAEDLVWVHDYHLMLMPRMLRQQLYDNGANVSQVMNEAKFIVILAITHTFVDMHWLLSTHPLSFF